MVGVQPITASRGVLDKALTDDAASVSKTFLPCIALAVSLTCPTIDSQHHTPCLASPRQRHQLSQLQDAQLAAPYAPVVPVSKSLSRSLPPEDAARAQRRQSPRTRPLRRHSPSTTCLLSPRKSNSLLASYYHSPSRLLPSPTRLHTSLLNTTTSLPRATHSPLSARALAARPPSAAV
jgi:hypothetical protein